MSRSEAYAKARAAAASIRIQYGINGPCLKLSDMRAIYRDQGIKLVYWPHKMRVLRGAYILDDLGPTVMVYQKLPTDPKVFTLAHELKHHLLDSGVCSTSLVDDNSAEREIAAEVFAAELLLPEDIFLTEMAARNLFPRSGASIEATKIAIVRFKRESGTTLSYQGLAKRAERLGFGAKGTLTNVHWKKFEESQYGIPFYIRKK